MAPFQGNRNHSQERKRTAAEIETLLESTARKLKLRKPPRRMECFDISALQGDWAVGTMAAFADGEPDRRRYRKYRIRMSGECNDYAMIAEALGRRYRRTAEEGGLPDLVVIDGGRGHLNIGLDVLKGLGLGDLDIVAIAKERSGRGDEEKTGDRIYIPGRVNPIPVGNRKALTMIARIRDEAHRTAIRYHRHLRSRGLTYSVLDDVQGVGHVLKKRLLERFGSVEGIGQADVKTLSEIRGVTPDLAGRILEAVEHSD
ncbi:helix-hairpin-helix domain-containing protein [Thermodesulfobacteriota bacterium]